MYYDRTRQLYRSDRAMEPLRTRDELLALLGLGDALTFLGVLPGSGSRLGGDRNGNGVLDADEPEPPLNFAVLPARLRLSWPELGKDWLLERTPTLGEPWRTDLSPRSRQGELQRVEHSLSEEPMEFFRLRRVW